MNKNTTLLFASLFASICFLHITALTANGAYAFKNFGKFTPLRTGKTFEDAYNKKRKQLDHMVNQNVKDQCLKNPQSHLVGIINRALELIAMRLVLIESKEVENPGYNTNVINKNAFESLLHHNAHFSYCLAGIIFNSNQFFRSHNANDIRFALFNLLSNSYEDRYLTNEIVGKCHEPQDMRPEEAHAHLVQSLTYSTEVKQAVIQDLFELVGEKACEANLAKLNTYIKEAELKF